MNFDLKKANCHIGANSLLFKLQKKLIKLELSCKHTCFIQYLSYLNPKVEDSSNKIDEFMASYIPKSRWAGQA